MRFRALGVIPARGGSKSVPKKNIQPLRGRPLIAYTITEALKSRMLTRTVVSTDDAEIAKVARAWGADVPFMRPRELAADYALATDVMRHAVMEIESQEGKPYDFAVMLQPTAPMRIANDIDVSLAFLASSGADSVISVAKVGHMHPNRMRKIVDGRLVDFMDGQRIENLPRQLLPPVYVLNGAIYAVKRDILVEMKSLRGKDCRPYVMPEERSANIDSEVDFTLADALLQGRHYQRGIKNEV